jgi:DNA-binding beta-propeller fold protein YncE
MSVQVSDDLRMKMAEWVEIKKNITEAKKDMKVLTDHEKTLKTFVNEYMKNNSIDKINLRQGKVTRKESVKKSPFNKASVEAGLNIYFSNDTARVESVLTCITDNLEEIKTSTVSLTGIKD